MARQAPLKPWQTGSADGPPTATSALALQSPSAMSAAGSTSPAIPARDGTGVSPGFSTYGGSYNTAGGYGSSYGSRYGSGYGGYGGGLSSYGGGYNRFGSSYGGYGSSYGSRYGGGYGSSFGSSYGGGYGGGYGSSYGGYGGGYGGYGGGMMQNGQMGPQGGMMQNGMVQRGMGWLQQIESVTTNVGRFSWLLDTNFQAVHGSFTSILQLIEGVTILTRELGCTFSSIFIIKLFYAGLRRIINMVMKAMGAKEEFNLKAFEKFSEESNVAASAGGKPKPKNKAYWASIFVTIGVFCIGGPLLIGIIEGIINRVRGGKKSGSMDKAWGKGERMRAQHDYRAQRRDELEFRAGEVIVIKEKPFDKWWVGEIEGVMPPRVGLVPSTLLSPIVETVKVEPVEPVK